MESKFLVEYKYANKTTINETDNFYLYIDKIYQVNFQQLEYILSVDKHRHFAKRRQNALSRSLR
jgi:hypothetical protein